MFNTVREKQRNLLLFDGIAGKEVFLRSLNGIGKAFFENELVVIADGHTDHKRSV